MHDPKPSYVSDRKNTANSGPMSLALRELRGNLRSPVFWMVVGASILMAALAGPYYTLERLNFAERLVYWATTVTLSAVLMTFLSIYAYRLTDAHNWNWILVAVLAGVAGIIPVVATIYIAEALTNGFETGWPDGPDFTVLLISAAPPLIAVTVVVSGVIHYQHLQTPDPAPTQQRALTLLQSKLPHHLGTEIVAVQAQDHYVEVTTPKGRVMVLMRLSDAVQDLAPLEGMQVHRSWWVNMTHVVRTEKGSSGPEVVLSSGQRIPVGRSFVKRFRAAQEGVQ